MTLWLSQIPSWLSFAVLVITANAVALLLVAGARAWARKLGVAAGPPVVNSWATCVGALTALLFAFTIVTLWNATTRVRSDVDAEVAAMRLVARDLVPSQLPMLRNYATATIVEWPKLCGLGEAPAANAALDRLVAFGKPRSNDYADDLYRQLGTLEDLRNRRWQASTSAVPDEIWGGLVVLSLSLFVVLAIALPEHRHIHIALTLAVATAVGTLFWVAIVLEYPYCGTGAVLPTEMIDLMRTHVM